jgi:hypothetical protein
MGYSLFDSNDPAGVAHQDDINIPARGNSADNLIKRRQPFGGFGGFGGLGTPQGTSFGAAPGAPGGSGGAALGGYAPINVHQIDPQQRINTMRGENDMRTATNTQNMSQGVAKQGYGSNSPLAAQLAATMQQGNLATNTQGEQDIRNHAADYNAAQTQFAQGLKSGQTTASNQAINDNQKNMNQYQLGRYGEQSQNWRAMNQAQLQNTAQKQSALFDQMNFMAQNSYS